MLHSERAMRGADRPRYWRSMGGGAGRCDSSLGRVDFLGKGRALQGSLELPGNLEPERGPNSCAWTCEPGAGNALSPLLRCRSDCSPGFATAFSVCPWAGPLPSVGLAVLTFCQILQAAELHGPGVICGNQIPIQRAELAWAQSITVLSSPLWPDFWGQ